MWIDIPCVFSVQIGRNGACSGLVLVVGHRTFMDACRIGIRDFINMDYWFLYCHSHQKEANEQGV